MTNGRVSPAVSEHWNRVAAGASELAEGIAAFGERRAPRFEWTGESAD